MAALEAIIAESVEAAVRRAIEPLRLEVERLRAVSAPAGDALLTSEQAAQELGLAPKTVRRLAREGALAGTRRGASWRFSRASLEAYRTGGSPGAVAAAVARLVG